MSALACLGCTGSGCDLWPGHWNMSLVLNAFKNVFFSLSTSLFLFFGSIFNILVYFFLSSMLNCLQHVTLCFNSKLLWLPCDRERVEWLCSLTWRCERRVGQFRPHTLQRNNVRETENKRNRKWWSYSDLSDSDCYSGLRRSLVNTPR